MPTQLLFTLLCDDAREEKSGKLTIVGLYNYVIGFAPPDPSLNLGAAPVRFGLPQFCIVQRWQIDTPGRKAVVEIAGPQGETLARAEVPFVISQDGGFCQAIVKFVGVLLSPGTHTVRTVLGNLKYEEHFEVRINPPQGAPSRSPNLPPA